MFEDFGCFYCWDQKRKKEKELYFFDAANNMRLCEYCPKCGCRMVEPQESEE